MPLLLLLLFLIVPVVEIYVLIQVGQAIGAGPTVLLLILDALLGTWLFKREGRKAWTALTEAIAAHRVPGKEVADGALVVVGGAFLITPGFVSDVVGVLCLLPPTRALLRGVLTKVVTARLLGGLPKAPRGRPRPTVHEVIDGEVLDPKNQGE
ncbi:MAG: phage exclusion suppressor FxsA [Frankiales bacterium]|nr:phage exclusion suppressor FxsA [Frankiales bacterium]